MSPTIDLVFKKKTGFFTFVDQPIFNQIGFVDDLEGGTAIWPSYISEDDYMVSYINAIDFISHSKTESCSDKFKTIASELKDTDNPVLVLVKLKGAYEAKYIKAVAILIKLK